MKRRPQLDRLPNELLIEILGHGSLQKSKADLISLSLVSRRLSPIAQRELFHSVVFEVERGTKRGPDDAQMTHKRIQSIILDNRLASYVQSLRIEHCYTYFSKDNGVLGLAMEALSQSGVAFRDLSTLDLSHIHIST